MCHVDFDIICKSGNRLRNFTIIVGTSQKKCGSSRNYMITGETTAFPCEANAKGNSLQIQINGRKEILTLCEVLVFGAEIGEGKV